MKTVFFVAFLSAFSLFLCSPDPDPGTGTTPDPEPRTYDNVIVVTLDGLNWTEVYGHTDVLNTTFLKPRADLYGNRHFQNRVSVANPSKQSYPGYHEIFTGNIEGITDNRHINSPHKTVFEFLNEQPGFEDVNVMSVGLSEFPQFLFANGTFPVISPRYAKFRGREFSDPLTNPEFLTDPEVNSVVDVDNLLAEIALESIAMKPLIHNFGDSKNNQDDELLIYLMSKKILEKVKPRAMYISFVLTDHFAHKDDWDAYVKAAKNVGIYIQDLVQFVNSNEVYKNNTAILITTDHGRSESNFRNHSGDSFFILITPETSSGIITSENQYHNEQLAQTIARLLGFEYTAAHSIAPQIHFE